MTAPCRAEVQPHSTRPALLAALPRLSQARVAGAGRLGAARIRMSSVAILGCYVTKFGHFRVLRDRIWPF